MSLQAVILAAGEGIRLRPLTQNRPKALIPVTNRPILEHVITSLTRAGIRDIIVVVGYRKEQVMRHLVRIDLPITIVTQHEQLGTAHALSCAKNSIAGDVLVIPGDNYIDPDSLRDLTTTKNALLYTTHKQPSNFGVVTIENGFVKSITEKPVVANRMTVSCGIYHLNHDLVNRITHDSMSDVINTEIQKGTTITALQAHSWQDAIYPWDLLGMNEKLLHQISPEKSGIMSTSVSFEGVVSVGKGTKLGPGTVISGPVIIGEDCIIGPHVVIEPGTSIGSRVRIEPFTRIKNSVIMDDVLIASHCSISGSVLGEGCTLEESTKAVHRTGYISVDEKPVRSSCGVIMGNGVYCSPAALFENVMIGNDVSIQGQKKQFCGVHIPDKIRVM